ncbi:carboxypeptidase-like regulatory domain-containing protein [Flavihumibacter sp. CACIAM 22H1]|uniref:carboxypeptidase-like regulatory domain-containing protein n=1 Tax=Flavihumibacter sp. CACIAM 22H1 TaxID=1812911 RepID=UPI000A4DE842|nr:carboxypeptidase-like regulatory domain-containing protein [Flavihumibacter sp. CACIAM 22H1]
MKNFRSFILLTGTILGTQLALANNGTQPKPGSELPKEEGTVHGYVVDAATRKPVSGVVVSASYSKKTFKKEVSTDASGYFRLDELPAGDVLIYFDKKGYRMLKKSALCLKEKSVMKLTVDLQEEAVVFEHPALRLIDGIFN